MKSDRPLQVAQWFLALTATDLKVYYRERIPSAGGFLIVSNHRSVMDALVLMVGIERSIHFICHYFMTQVPLLREIIKGMDCLPLGMSAQSRSHRLFSQAQTLLQAQEVVGIFPEGADPMVDLTPLRQIGKFSNGFAHLALRIPLENLTVLPVAIVSEKEWVTSVFPIRTLKAFDPSEPLFDQNGWHPMVIYRQVKLLIGRPYLINKNQHHAYRGKLGKFLRHQMIDQLVNYCHTEISHLLDDPSNISPNTSPGVIY